MTKGRVFRILTLLLALALVLVTLSACDTPIPTPRANKVVATAGSEEIYYDELYFLAMNHIRDMEADEGDDVLSDEAGREALEAFVWENLLRRDHALISVARDYGIELEKGEIAEEVEKHVNDLIDNNFDSWEDYVTSLNEMYMTDRYLRAYIAVENYLAVAIVKEMMTRGELDTSDTTASTHIYSDDLIRTVHVFFSNENQLYTKEENAAHAAALQAQLAAISDDRDRYDAMYDAIGGKYNNDFSDLAGNGYYFSRGEMSETYEKAAFALSEYGVSDVVESTEGYYVIMRLPKNEEYIQSHFEELKQKTYFITLNAKVEARLAEMELQKTDYGADLDLTALAPIDADGGTAIYVCTGVIVGAVVLGAVFFLLSKLMKRRHGKYATK